MHAAPKFVHHAPGYFRKPKIHAGEQRENRARRDDVMKMRDDVIGVVQIQIARRESTSHAKWQSRKLSIFSASVRAKMARATPAFWVPAPISITVRLLLIR